VVIEELKTAGFRLERRIDKWDGRLYCLVFQKQAAFARNEAALREKEARR
jgi:hypothetical protein